MTDGWRADCRRGGSSGWRDDATRWNGRAIVFGGGGGGESEKRYAHAAPARMRIYRLPRPVGGSMAAAAADGRRFPYHKSSGGSSGRPVAGAVRTLIRTGRRRHPPHPHRRRHRPA